MSIIDTKPASASVARRDDREGGEEETMRYTAPADVYLEVGPDSYHEGSLGPLTFEEMAHALRRTPEDLERESHEEGSPWRDRVRSAIADHNNAVSSDEERRGSMIGWRWQGMRVSALDEGIRAWIWQRMAIDGRSDQIHIWIDGDGAPPRETTP